MLSGLKTAARALYNLYPIATKPGELSPGSNAGGSPTARGERRAQPESHRLAAGDLCPDGRALYERWCTLTRDVWVKHRKVWEWVYILEVLKQHGMLAEGKPGLGFGCGAEPLSVLMASIGWTARRIDIRT